MAQESTLFKRRGLEVLLSDVKVALHESHGALPTTYNWEAKTRAAFALYLPRESGNGSGRVAAEVGQLALERGLQAALAAGAPPVPGPALPLAEVDLLCPWCGAEVVGSAAYADHRRGCGKRRAAPRPQAPTSTSSTLRGPQSRGPQPERAPDPGAAAAAHPALPRDVAFPGMYPALAHAAHLLVSTAMPSLIKRPLQVAVRGFVMAEFGLVRADAEACMNTRQEQELPPALAAKLDALDVAGKPLRWTTCAYRAACVPLSGYNNAPSKTSNLSAAALNARLLSGVELRNHMSKCAQLQASRRGSRTPPAGVDLLPRLAWGTQPLHIRPAAVPALERSAQAVTLFHEVVARHADASDQGRLRLWQGCVQEIRQQGRWSDRGEDMEEEPEESAVARLLNGDNQRVKGFLTRHGQPTSFVVVNDELHLLFGRPVFAPRAAEAGSEEESARGEAGFVLHDDSDDDSDDDVDDEVSRTGAPPSAPGPKGTALDHYTLFLRDHPPAQSVRHFDSVALSRSKRDFMLGKSGLYHLSAVPVRVGGGGVNVCLSPPPLPPPVPTTTPPVPEAASHPHPFAPVTQTYTEWRRWKQAKVLGYDPGRRLLLSGLDRYITAEVCMEVGWGWGGGGEGGGGAAPQYRTMSGCARGMSVQAVCTFLSGVLCRNQERAA